MWPMILLVSRLPGGYSMSAGRLPTVDSLLIGTQAVQPLTLRTLIQFSLCSSH